MAEDQILLILEKCIKPGRNLSNITTHAKRRHVSHQSAVELIRELVQNLTWLPL